MSRPYSFVAFCLAFVISQTSFGDCLGFLLPSSSASIRIGTGFCRSRVVPTDSQRRQTRPSKQGAPRRHVLPALWGPTLSFTPLCADIGAAQGGSGPGPVGGQQQGDDEEEEARRLMSVPTIDIKLELQMRGVEHRDAFEKLDLARRLAEARASSSSTRSTAVTDGVVVDVTLPDRTIDSSGVANDDTVRNRDRQEARVSGEATAHSSSAKRSQDGQGEQEHDEDTAAEDEYHARDIARAMYMGKPSVTRELNAMGIAHSRLSDLSVLARQYASGRGEARQEAGESRFFRTEHDLEQRLEVARLVALGRAELVSRLRAWEVRVPEQASEAELAKLLVKASDGNPRADEAEGFRQDSSSDKGESYGQEDDNWRRSEREKQGWGWERWTSGRRGGSAAATLPRHEQEEADEKGDEEEDWEEEQEEEEEERFRGARSWGRASGIWRADNKGDDETDWTARESAPSSADGSAAAGAGVQLKEGARQGPPAADTDRMKVPLQARAGRMSSRELMNALDSLGVRYRIPTARPELEQAFVCAVLHRQTAAGDRGAANGGDANGNSKLVSLNPYAGAGEREAYKDHTNNPLTFETYHAALRWARQLTSDDVIDELDCRGVEFKRNADFSYLTRLLADEVMADEELMEAEGREAEYSVEFEAAMAMTTEAICDYLRAGGVEFNPASSKAQLAQRLAETKVHNAKSLADGEDRPTAFTRSQRPRPQVQNRAAAVVDRGDRLWQGVEKRAWRKKRTSSSGVGVSSLFDLGDGEGDNWGEYDDTEGISLELEAAARTVGGMAWLAMQESASYLAAVASTLLPEQFLEREEREEDEERSPRAAGGSRQRQTVGASHPRTKQARRTRRMRERASGVRRAAAGFVQSSANRAGLAMVHSAANGVLRSAEAAADWAGGGTVAREHVLLFIAVFCLAFKRGISSSVALLIVIRAGRIAAQKLLNGGRGMRRRRTTKTTPDAPARRQRRPAAAASSASGRETGRTTSSSSSGRRSSAPRTRTKITGPPKGTKDKRRSGKTKQSSPTLGVGDRRGTSGAKRGRKNRQNSSWDDGDDGEWDVGCTVM